MTAISLYWNTIRYLKPVQIGYRLRRRLPVSIHVGGENPPLRKATGEWIQPPERESRIDPPNRFRFLNLQREIDLETWAAADAPVLWQYNLHYFEDLLRLDAPEHRSMHRSLIQSWIRCHRSPGGIAWRAYPTSVRITNWIKWGLSGGELDNAACDSLARQTRWLSRNLEYETLGNHLIANAKGLIFAGAFFAGPEADRWRGIGEQLLKAQLPEQILSDGAHFERSPMYHAVVLEDILDLINLARRFSGLDDVAWRETARRMLSWLRKMTHPDGEIALFQDAAFGIAADYAALADYAGRLGLGVDCQFVDQPGPSGYARLERGGTVVFVDVGTPGPSYIPAHAHAGALSLEVSHQARRIIVDTGTSTYEDGPLRLKERETFAHNTVTIDGRNQSDVWGSFRLGFRAAVWTLGAGDDFVEAAHDGYARLGIEHRRHVKLLAGHVEITDSLEGRGTHRAEFLFHLHPDCRVAEVTREKLVTADISCDGEAIARLCASGPGLNIHAEPAVWCPRFGERIPSTRIRLEASITAPATFHTTIRFLTGPS